MNLENIVDIEVNGIDSNDYPDFSDAYISSANWNDSGEALTDAELDTLNQDYGQFVYETVMDYVF